MYSTLACAPRLVFVAWVYGVCTLSSLTVTETEVTTALDLPINTN
jgi:hypothetical protein